VQKTATFNTSLETFYIFFLDLNYAFKFTSAVDFVDWTSDLGSV